MREPDCRTDLEPLGPQDLRPSRLALWAQALRSFGPALWPRAKPLGPLGPSLGTSEPGVGQKFVTDAINRSFCLLELSNWIPANLFCRLVVSDIRLVHPELLWVILELLWQFWSPGPIRMDPEQDFTPAWWPETPE